MENLKNAIFFSIQMAPIDGINQNDCWQIIFVPKSPKAVEKSGPMDHFRSFFHYFDKSGKRLNGSCIVVKFWSFLFRMSKYIVLGPLDAIGLIPQRFGYKLKIGFFSIRTSAGGDFDWKSGPKSALIASMKWNNILTGYFELTFYSF